MLKLCALLLALACFIQGYHIHYHTHCTEDKVTCGKYCEELHALSDQTTEES